MHINWTPPCSRMARGNLLEDSFRQSLLISEGDAAIFFRNTICIAFWMLTCLSLLVLVRSRVKAARSGKASILTSGG